MGDLCNTLIGWVEWFLWFAFLAALADVLIAIWGKLPTKQVDRRSREGVAAGDPGKVLEGLAKVLAALKELPAWIAIFLAAMALAWTAATAPGLCT